MLHHDLSRFRCGRLAIAILLGIGAMTGVASGQTITEFPIPTVLSGPEGITAGPDGNLWFTELGADKIGRITTSGSITEFPLPNPGSQPVAIASGPDGNLWFTRNFFDPIGRITTAGSITGFPLPGVYSPGGITAGPDGNLWFAEGFTDEIGRITPSGSLVEFAIPTALAQPVGIAAGPDGNLWFTENAANMIGRITPAGVITEFPIPTAGSGPRRIAAGSDGSLWFTESAANQIGRITTAPAPPASFHTVTPCRVVDTRKPDGPLGGPALLAGTDRVFTIAGNCAVPMTAKAVSVNLTVTAPTAAGNLRLYPAGTVLPLVSAVNYVAALTRANNAVVGLGAAGALAVRCAQASGTAHFVLDVNGYFE